MTAEVTEPAVRALIEVINAGDRDAFFAAVTRAPPCPTMARTAT